MSKRITNEGLSKLRVDLREKGVKAILETDNFDLSLIDTESVDYPVINEDDLSVFYKQYEQDPKNEFQLAKILYESLNLTDVQASDNLFWIYLNLNHFFKYLKNRWVRVKDKEEEDKLISRFEEFFLAIKPSQNSLIQSAIAGLWWAVHLTIDPNSEDKYYYTKIFLSDRNLRNRNGGAYQFARHRFSLYAFLDFYNENKDAKWNGERIGSEAIAQQTSKALNQIGALTLLSFLNKEEIKDKLDRYKTVILKRANAVRKGKVVSREKIKKVQDKSITKNNTNEGTLTAEPENRNLLSSKKPVRILRYFNLNSNGNYSLTRNKDEKFKYNLAIPQKYKNGYLLICYNEHGYINRVTVKSLLQKNRSEYMNGLYKGQTLKRLLLIPKRAIIGIFYNQGGMGYFKAYLSDQFKKNNTKVGLQGYKTMYVDYDKDSLDFVVLPIEIKESISKLILSSFAAAGKALKNPYYKQEFKEIQKYVTQKNYF